MSTTPTQNIPQQQYASREEQLRARRARPMTPGQFLAGLMEENNITQTALAVALGVSRPNLNNLINGKRGLSADMAHRLARYFGNSVGSWLQMQATVELWDALHVDASRYENITPMITAR